MLASFSWSQAQIFSENFNNGSSLPTGWTTENTGSSANWEVGAMANFASFPDGAAYFDDDAAGASSFNSNAYLISPVINLSGATNPTLSFSYANMVYDYDTTISAEVFDGTSWVQVFNSIGDSGVWGIDWNLFMYTVDAYETATNIDLSPYINPNFKVRFKYDDAGDYSYGAVIDNVVISGTILSTADSSVKKGDIKVYPNPTSNIIFLDNIATNAKTQVKVYDVSGKLVKSFEGNDKEYSIQELPTGNYLMIIENGKDIYRKKIIKK